MVTVQWHSVPRVKQVSARRRMTAFFSRHTAGISQFAGSQSPALLDLLVPSIAPTRLDAPLPIPRRRCRRFRRSLGRDPSASSVPSPSRSLPSFGPGLAFVCFGCRGPERIVCTTIRATPRGARLSFLVLAVWHSLARSLASPRLVHPPRPAPLLPPPSLTRFTRAPHRLARYLLARSPVGLT